MTKLTPFNPDLRIASRVDTGAIESLEEGQLIQPSVGVFKKDKDGTLTACFSVKRENCLICVEYHGCPIAKEQGYRK